ncbi:conserved hypothetical protein [Candidatus Desulfarcum epimagneticum]|uniref:Uncharacterized protein n=1 Tax=uncultured Desulfobacteraceae bacterium TaxID=218296 RepID=A0A484HDG8_9BACT|nr:conserved hypothetical protein [uncultured Desulfobacteraceae bacterium]
MDLYVNDLSLSGQFPDPRSVREALEPLLKLRSRDPNFRGHFYCSRIFCARKATGVHDLRQSILGTRDKLFIGQALAWLAKSGPFWEDHRCSNPDDYFEYQTQDVTDQGLGEAARGIISGSESGVFSFRGARIAFEKSPLRVRQGLPEAPINDIDVRNFWTTEQLIEVFRSAKRYKDWQDVYAEISSRFSGLLFSNHAISPLLSTPFSKQVAKRIFELLQILNGMVVESDENGELSPRGKELLNDHFVGKKAWFTDESPTNKARFKQHMTFPDPEDRKKRIFCPWHGKIKTPQVRIHFEWPRPKGQKNIKVVYIGPKITKG